MVWHSEEYITPKLLKSFKRSGVADKFPFYSFLTTSIVKFAAKAAKAPIAANTGIMKAPIIPMVTGISR